MLLRADPSAENKQFRENLVRAGAAAYRENPVCDTGDAFWTAVAAVRGDDTRTILSPTYLRAMPPRATLLSFVLPPERETARNDQTEPTKKSYAAHLNPTSPRKPFGLQPL